MSATMASLRGTGRTLVGLEWAVVGVAWCVVAFAVAARGTDATSSAYLAEMASFAALVVALAARRERGPMKASDVRRRHASLFPSLTDDGLMDGPGQGRGTALSPADWARDHRCVLLDGRVDRKAAEVHLAAQVGARWTGQEGLKAGARCVAVACAMVATRGRAQARPFLEAVAQAHAGRRPERIEALLARTLDAGLSEWIGNVAKDHAYANTALVGMLAEARRRDILPTAEMSWFKGHDRSAWYGLNNLGRRSFHAEGLGITCHYESERKAGGALTEPQVREAVAGLAEEVDPPD